MERGEKPITMGDREQFEEDRLVATVGPEYWEEEKRLLQKGKEDNVTIPILTLKEANFFS